MKAVTPFIPCRPILVLTLLILFPAAAGIFPLPAQVTGSGILPELIEFGSVPEGNVTVWSFPVKNDTAGILYVEFIPTCDCVTLDPREMTLGPGETVTVNLSFDSSGYSGEVLKEVLVRSSDQPYNGKRLKVSALVNGAEAQDSNLPCDTCKEIAHLEAMKLLSSAGKSGILFGEIFYSAGCRECERFLSTELPELEKTSGVPLVIKTWNIMEDTGFNAYLERTESPGIRIGSFPALLVDGKIAEGVPAMRALLEERIAAFGTAGAASEAGTETPGDGLKGGSQAGERETPAARPVLSGGLLGGLPVIAAGLIDGINPCAFSTLIFLVSALTVYGRTRRQILITGAVFAASVFTTYYLVGLGAFSAVRTASAFPLIAAAIRWVLFASLIVFSGLSIYDGFLVRAGKTGSMILQLPGSMKRRVHAAVHGGMKSASLVAGTAVMGFLVSVFELACTGQVYLPTIAWMVSEGETAGYWLLLLYNIAFILPLAGVFILAYTGTGSPVLADFFRRHTATVKFALAGVFLLLALLSVLS